MIGKTGGYFSTLLVSNQHSQEIWSQGSRERGLLRQWCKYRRPWEKGEGKRDTVDLIVVVGKWGAPEGARKDGNAGGKRWNNTKDGQKTTRNRVINYLPKTKQNKYKTTVVPVIQYINIHIQFGWTFFIWTDRTFYESQRPINRTPKASHEKPSFELFSRSV